VQLPVAAAGGSYNELSSQLTVTFVAFISLAVADEIAKTLVKAINREAKAIRRVFIPNMLHLSALA
jgi:hypothetical protein